MAFTKITAAGIGSTETVTLDGLSVINNGSFGGNLTVSGVLTYEDVTNVDSVGVITARAGVLVGSGITLSKDGDVFFTGIATGDGSGLTALNASNISSGTVPTARLGSGTASSSTFLRGDSTFQTVNTDLVSDTSPQLGGSLDVNSKNINFGDSSGGGNNRIVLGTGSDLNLYSDGDNVRYEGNNLQFKNANGDEFLAKMTNGGAVELYHNNSKKIETAGAGVTVTGTVSLSDSDVALNQFSVGIGTSTTTGYQAGVSTAAGTLTFDTTINQVMVFTSGASAEWKQLKYDFNDGSTALKAARSAKELLDNGVTTDGVYYLNMHGAYSQANSKLHYCLMDSTYDGGGWTLLYSMNHGNNFASGTNYSFSVNVGSNPTTISDFTASNFGYDRRNTFTPAANDQFLIRRSDNNDWRRFVVTTWSPTANSVSNGWETTNKTDGSDTGHPYWALGQMYDTSGNAVSGYTHFNGCALGGNCGSGGGDGSGFGDYDQWLDAVGNNAYGGGYNSQSNGGSPLYWGSTALTQGSTTFIQMFYRKAGTQ